MNVANRTLPEKPDAIFPTTHWTTVLQPISQRSDQSQMAVNRLFEIYRRPIVAYVRTLVRNPQHTEDIAQDFITRLLARGDLVHADRARGRFRAYLRTSIKHHVFSHYVAEDAKKRKPLNQAVPIEGLVSEPCDANDAEKEFTRQWWRATIDESVRRLRAEWDIVGKAALFDDLQPLLWERRDGMSINGIAAKHHMTPNAVSLRKMRLLERFRELLLAVVGETVGSPSEAREEISYLLQDP